MKHNEKKPAYGGSPLCNCVFREIRNQGAWLPERRVKYLERNYFETANSQVFPPAPLIRVEIETRTTQTFSSSWEHMEANSGLTLLSTLVLRRKEYQDRMWLPTTLKRQLQRRKAGRVSKQSSGNRTHRSMSLELCATDDPDIQHAHWQDTAEQLFK